MQEVELDSKIKLIDCPGIVFTQTKNADNQIASNILKNAQRVTDVKDPFKVAESILQRASKMYFCRLYDISEYDTPEEFFAKKAARTGKFRRGGVPDSEGAARSLLNDWNTGKIKYCTQPPEADAHVHISAAIVSDEAREFEIENFDQMETDVLNNFTVKVEDAMEVISTGPVHMQHNDDEISGAHIIEHADSKMEDSDSDEPTQKRSRKQGKKVDPEMLLDGKISLQSILFRSLSKNSFLFLFLGRIGNQTSNKNIKDMRKKMKKANKRSERKVNAVADVLENFSLDMSGGSGGQDYDFDADFN